jgi:EpsI family protein
MGKKQFIVLLILVCLTSAFALTVKYYRADVSVGRVLANIPLAEGQWIGGRDDVPEYVIEVLDPDDIFSAYYTNGTGQRVHLFIDYFSPDNRSGGIHSPRNCLPGSGWMIEGNEEITIVAAGRKIPAARFYLSLGKSRQVMDFWYVTRYGETANDYRLKFNTMVSSLTLQPTDKAFIRFVTANDPASIAAMEEFIRLISDDIYRNLPF